MGHSCIQSEAPSWPCPGRLTEDGTWGFSFSLGLFLPAFRADGSSSSVTSNIHHQTVQPEPHVPGVPREPGSVLGAGHQSGRDPLSARVAPSAEMRLGTATGICKVLQSAWKSIQGVRSGDLEKASQTRGELTGTSKNELRLARPWRGRVEGIPGRGN